MKIKKKKIISILIVIFMLLTNVSVYAEGMNNYNNVSITNTQINPYNNNLLLNNISNFYKYNSLNYSGIDSLKNVLLRKQFQTSNLFSSIANKEKIQQKINYANSGQNLYNYLSNQQTILQNKINQNNLYANYQPNISQYVQNYQLPLPNYFNQQMELTNFPTIGSDNQSPVMLYNAFQKQQFKNPDVNEIAIQNNLTNSISDNLFNQNKLNMPNFSRLNTLNTISQISNNLMLQNNPQLLFNSLSSLFNTTFNTTLDATSVKNILDNDLKLKNTNLIQKNNIMNNEENMKLQNNQLKNINKKQLENNLNNQTIMQNAFMSLDDNFFNLNNFMFANNNLLLQNSYDDLENNNIEQQNIVNQNNQNNKIKKVKKEKFVKLPTEKEIKEKGKVVIYDGYSILKEEEISDKEIEKYLTEEELPYKDMNFLDAFLEISGFSSEEEITENNALELVEALLDITYILQIEVDKLNDFTYGKVMYKYRKTKEKIKNEQILQEQMKFQNQIQQQIQNQNMNTMMQIQQLNNNINVLNNINNMTQTLNNINNLSLDMINQNNTINDTINFFQMQPNFYGVSGFGFGF